MAKSKKEDYIRESLKMFSRIESLDRLCKIYTFIKVSYEHETEGKMKEGERLPTNQKALIIDLLLRKKFSEERLDLIYRFVRGMEGEQDEL